MFRCEAIDVWNSSLGNLLIPVIDAGASLTWRLSGAGSPLTLAGLGPRRLTTLIYQRGWSPEGWGKEEGKQEGRKGGCGGGKFTVVARILEFSALLWSSPPPPTIPRRADFHSERLPHPSRQLAHFLEMDFGK